MSIHTVTEEITIHSEVEVLASPGANTETISRTARAEVDRVCAQVGLYLPATDIYTGYPVFQEGRVWLINITMTHRTTKIVDLEE